jgi:hypothetical protein
VYGEGYMNEPKVWWADIYTIDAAFGVAEQQLDGAGEQRSRLPAARDFEDLARGE